ncbi:MAG: hypothetical protein UR52_C0021G0004 [Candidatus Gottesmanbacteria bacterium GW2011_GWA1_34_13]|uniref:AB hydrolase-1 domain-containing protein n=1 Tax=Candidatus Gottesmanbacteria bacterium GW2011_GWA1_34_13 TaxID=1618434 RepID=A0A0G0AMY4_9BACT|nr:MAG: hypothetical protein UR52_C0021G0004 [Candidatus Gottesmanbacteria bacterium GW2011_GWA1_34_13]
MRVRLLLSAHMENLPIRLKEPLGKSPNIVLIHGNWVFGKVPQWISNFKKDLPGLLGDVNIWGEKLPSPVIGKSSKWLPVLESLIDENTFIGAHSTGTLAAFRIAEKHKIKVLVAACPYDTYKLPLPFPVPQIERMGGWFDKDFNWAKIYNNIEKIVILAPLHDKSIPEIVAQRVIDQFKNLDEQYGLNKFKFVRPEGGHEIVGNVALAFQQEIVAVVNSLR